MEMQLLEAKNIIESLSEPNKMPCYAWSIPAENCKTGSRLRKVHGSTCSKCYAMRHHYMFPTVKAALRRRLRAIKHPKWAEAMVVVLSSPKVRKHRYFRWFDSGDIQSLTHLKKIVEVCKRTPFIRHWMPTREYGIVQRFIAGGGTFPNNLVIRMSAPMIDGPAPKWWKWTSGVHSKDEKPKGKLCGAKYTDNKCADCRACWDKSIKHISYPKH